MINSWRNLKKVFTVIITVSSKISSCQVKMTITYSRMRFFKFYLELAYAYTRADSVTCTILLTNIIFLIVLLVFTLASHRIQTLYERRVSLFEYYFLADARLTYVHT